MLLFKKCLFNARLSVGSCYFMIYFNRVAEIIVFTCLSNSKLSALWDSHFILFIIFPASFSASLIAIFPNITGVLQVSLEFLFLPLEDNSMQYFPI